MTNSLKVFNTEIIPVYETDEGEQVVKGRELHERLGIKNDYTHWFKDMCAYGFENEKDFMGIFPKSTGGRPKTDHIMKLDMAKHIAMIQRTPIGTEIRQKLIDLEKKVSAGNFMTRTELIASALVEAEKILQEKNEEIEEMKPKAFFADAVTASESSILIGALAKLLTQNGYRIGQNNLFSKLRNEGYLIKQNSGNRNLPTQRAMNMGLFEIQESVHTCSDGSSLITQTTKVTGKGQKYFINKFCSEHEEDDSEDQITYIEEVTQKPFINYKKYARRGL